MNKYPNMLPELLEAVHGYFEDNPDVEVDVYLYLTSLRNDLSRSNKLSNAVESILIDMNRCPYCGTPFVTSHYKEIHSEIEGHPSEIMTETYCPICGKE